MRWRGLKTEVSKDRIFSERVRFNIIFKKDRIKRS